MGDKFWMVYGGHQSAPSKAHESKKTAKEEAERLCRKHNSTFFVLEVVAKVMVKEAPTETVDIN